MVKPLIDKKLNDHQLAVESCLSACKEPMSAYKILQYCTKNSPDCSMSAPQQVYRALDKLIALGLVHRIESLNAYVVCTQHDHTHQHHTLFALCDECGQSTEFCADDTILQLYLSSKEFNFNTETIRIELHGCCVICQTNHPQAGIK